MALIFILSWDRDSLCIPGTGLELLKYTRLSRVVVAYAFDPSIWEAEVGVFLQVRGFPDQHNKFQGNQGY